MQLPAGLKVEKLASKDATRPALNALYLRIEGTGDERVGFLEGTDAYKLARIPVVLDEHDVEGFVSLEAIATARKLKCDEIICNDSLELRQYEKTVCTLERENRGQFPNTVSLFPAEAARIDGGRFVIGLNPKLLLELADAMGSDTVSLEFAAYGLTNKTTGGHDSLAPSPLRPITVRPLATKRNSAGTKDSIALLMPVRCETPDWGPIRAAAGIGPK